MFKILLLVGVIGTNIFAMEEEEINKDRSIYEKVADQLTVFVLGEEDSSIKTQKKTVNCKDLLKEKTHELLKNSDDEKEDDNTSTTNIKLSVEQKLASFIQPDIEDEKGKELLTNLHWTEQWKRGERVKRTNK